jgi:hypothetical protein
MEELIESPSHFGIFLESHTQRQRKNRCHSGRTSVPGSLVCCHFSDFQEEEEEPYLLNLFRRCPHMVLVCIISSTLARFKMTK